MATEKLQFVIGGENSSGVRAIRDMNAELDKLTKNTDSAAGKVNTFANRLDALNAAQSAARGSAAELAASHKQIAVQAELTAGKLGRVNAQLSNFRQAREHTRALYGEINNLATGALKLGGAMVAVGGAISLSLGKSAADLALARLQQEAGLKALEGSAAGAARELAILQDLAKNPALNLDQAIAADLKLRNAGASAKLAHEAIAEFANAAAGSGAGPEKLGLALEGLSQMFSKGAISAEELRGQILEHLPAISPALEKAFGTKSVESIAKMNLTVEEFVQKLVGVLQASERVDGGVPNAIDNVKTAWTEAKIAFGKGLFEGESRQQAEELAGKLDDLQKSLYDLGQQVGPVLAKLADFTAKLLDNEAAALRSWAKIGMWTGAVLLAGGAAVKAVVGIAELKASIALLAGGADKGAVAVAGLSAKVLGILGAAAVGGAALQKFTNHLVDAGKEAYQTGHGIERAGGALKWWAGKVMEFVQSPVHAAFKAAMAALRWELQTFLDMSGAAAAMESTASVGGAFGGVGGIGAGVVGAFGTAAQMYGDAAMKAAGGGGGGGGGGVPAPSTGPARGPAKGAPKAGPVAPTSPSKYRQRPSSTPLPGTGQGGRSIGEADDSAAQIEQSRRQYQIDQAQRESAAAMVSAEAGIFHAQQGAAAAGQGQQGAAWQEVLAAHERFWQARADAAQKIAQLTGETTDLDRVLLDNERERAQLLDDQLDKQRQIVDERRRAREEAEAQAKADTLQAVTDKAELAQIKAERAKLTGASEQTQQALEAKARAAQLAQAAELARQGKINEAERLKNEVLRAQADQAGGGEKLQQAVIGGDLGRIQDILQAAHGYGNGLSGMNGDPVGDAIRGGRDRSPGIIAGAVEDRLERNALETARIIRGS